MCYMGDDTENCINFILYLIFDAVSVATYSEDYQEAKEANSWLFSKSQEQYSLDWYCDLIGLKPDKIRNLLIQYMAKPKHARNRGAGRLQNVQAI